MKIIYNDEEDLVTMYSAFGKIVSSVYNPFTKVMTVYFEKGYILMKAHSEKEAMKLFSQRVEYDKKNLIGKNITKWIDDLPADENSIAGLGVIQKVDIKNGENHNFLKCSNYIKIICENGAIERKEYL